MPLSLVLGPHHVFLLIYTSLPCQPWDEPLAAVSHLWLALYRDLEYGNHNSLFLLCLEMDMTRYCSHFQGNGLLYHNEPVYVIV